MKAPRRAAFTFGVAARLRAPPALHAAEPRRTQARQRLRSRSGPSREVLPQELDRARVGELRGRGVVLGSIVLHEPVLRAGVDVGLAATGSGLQLGLGVDELVVLGEMAEVGNALGPFEDVAVDGDEGSDLRPRLGDFLAYQAPKLSATIAAWSPRASGRASRSSSADPTSPRIRSYSLSIFWPCASASSIVVRTVPSKRSGAMTVNPSPARRSARALIGWLSPHQVCSSKTGGPVPVGGEARMQERRWSWAGLRTNTPRLRAGSRG